MPPALPPAGGGPQVGLNAAVWLRHRENVETVLGHPLFVNVQDHEPIGINKTSKDGDSGVQASFDLASAIGALTRRGRYKSAINLAWVNPYFSTSNNVPIMWSSVQECSMGCALVDFFTVQAYPPTTCVVFLKQSSGSLFETTIINFQGARLPCEVDYYKSGQLRGRLYCVIHLALLQTGQVDLEVWYHLLTGR